MFSWSNNRRQRTTWLAALLLLGQLLLTMHVTQHALQPDPDHNCVICSTADAGGPAPAAAVTSGLSPATAETAVCLPTPRIASFTRLSPPGRAPPHLFR